MWWYYVGAVVIPPLMLLYCLRTWLRGPQISTHTIKRLDGKVVVLTGGNNGIGAETALDLARRGAQVFILCRDQTKAERTIKWIKGECGLNAQIEFEICNLASFKSIRACVKSLETKISKVDYLINNAGVMWVPTSTPKTEEGFDMTFGTNHLGHFLLTDLLLPLIKKAAATENSRPRIINLSSCAHFSGRINEESLAAYLTTLQHDYLKSNQWLRGDHPTGPDDKFYGFDWAVFSYHAFARVNVMKSVVSRPSVQVYSDAKLANVLHARALHSRLNAQHGINTYSLHPGVIPSTGLFSHFMGSPGSSTGMIGLNALYGAINAIYLSVMKDNFCGAQTTLYCVLDDDLENQSGHYYSDCAKAQPHKAAFDQELVDWFYNESKAVIRKLEVKE